MAMDNPGTLKAEFLTEAREHLDNVEDDILKLENQGAGFDPEVLNRLFRAMHSIKGGSAFLQLENLKNLAHALENIVDSIRSRKIIPSQPITDLLLKGVDKLKILVQNLDNSAAIDTSREISDIEQVLSSPILQQAAAAPPPETPREPPRQSGQAAPLPVEKAAETGPPAADVSRPEDTLPLPAVFYLYTCTIDLLAECDRRGLPLEEFFRNLYLMGEIVDLDYDRAGIGTLDSVPGHRLLMQLKIRTIIDDQDILLEALAFTPLAISCTRETTQTADLPAAETAVIADTPQMAATRPKQDSAVPEQPAILPDRAVLPAPAKQETAPLPLPVQTTTTNLAGQQLPQLPGESVTRLSGQGPASIRISLNLLDKLMDYASELVLVRNQNMQAVESGDQDLLRGIAKKLNVVTSGLQAGILQTRMQPVDTVFTKFTRVVRDLAKTLRKEVALDIEGRDVELDKNIIESLSDPLTHLIRNAVDHGIELPAQREAAGKARCGRVLLGAYHKAGYVNIIIRDDGHGMDPAVLLNSAVSKGLVSREQAVDMDEEDALNLIFKPGFSTAGNVTDLSGRGVGMDVVKTNLHKIGGVIQIHSKQGQGSSFDIRLPLTLSIMHALIVLVEEICFAIPEFNIAEIVRLYGEDIYRNIKKVNEQEIFALRGKLVPVIRLAKILQMRETYQDPVTREKKADRRAEVPDEEAAASLPQRRSSRENSLHILILKLGNLRYGLIIDTILDTEEIVIKPLHEQIKDCQAYAGTTVLGDGRIAMILDIANLAELARFNLNKIERLNKKEQPVIEDKQTVITFTIGGRETFAIHLFLIAHIERIKFSELMVANSKEYFRFQDRLVRLVRLETALESVTARYPAEVFIIIIKGRHPVGILVAEIIDTSLISSTFDFEETSRPGIIGVMLIANALTMILDVFSIINTIEPGWFTAALQPDEIPRKILLLEDTKFYASLITSYLSGTGIEVIHARHGEEGIALLKLHTFDLIISDLAMPVMDGFAFAACLRKQPRYQNMKMIAISAAYAQKQGQTLAREAGFDEFVSKLDREGMLESFKKIARQQQRGEDG